MFYLIEIHRGSLSGDKETYHPSCIIARIRGYVYKMPGINSEILLHSLYIKMVKSKMLIIYDVNL